MSAQAGVAPRELGPIERRSYLIRAVVAATIGTTIEWYDFFLYSVVTGSVFAKLFFPDSDPLTGALKSFAIWGRRLPLAADRRGDLRSLWRPRRPEIDAHRRPAADGSCDIPRRFRAGL